jgi:UDP-4-amino-4-deoxy-L-arabinose formyltransferase/UDP-glucuronic acid dehydrogenase (UDP-4-keto-hexauronic acid decarboxylating)
LRTLLEMGESVVAVFTHPDDPGEKIWFDSVPRLAREHGILVHEVPSTSPKKRLPGGPAGYERLVEEARPDMILSASFRALIPRDVLNIPPRGSLNLHPSLLPRYRGRSPVNWVLVNGETETGMSLHHMVEAPDAGDIVGQVRLPIGPDETAPELQRRMDDVAETLLRRLLPQIGAGAAPRIPQDPAQSSYFGRRRPEDGRFEWSWPASRIHDLVRAVTRPYPGAFVLEPAGRLFVWRTRVLRDRSGLSLRPGETVTSSNYPHPVAGTGDGIIEILDSSRDKA